MARRRRSVRRNARDEWLRSVPAGPVCALCAAAAVVCGARAVMVGPRPEPGVWLPAAPVAPLLGAVALAGAYGVLFLIQPNGMGFGDVKLALTLGAALGWYGWDVLLGGAFLGFLAGAVYGTVLVLRGRAGRRTAMAFGPFMVLGAWAALLLGA